MTSREDSVLEVMRTCRAIRHYEQRNVPDDVILELLDAATKAPSASDAQNWRFIVVRDPAVMHELGMEVRRGTRWKMAVDRTARAIRRGQGDLTADGEARARRRVAAFEELADNYEQIPVLICVCVVPDSEATRAAYSWASVRAAIRGYGLVGALRMAIAGPRLAEQAMWASGYPAVQNILLAARAKGLGAVLTGPQLLSPPRRIERILGMPKKARLCAAIPVGYPRDKFGPVRRRPVEQLAFRDRWGTLLIGP